MSKNYKIVIIGLGYVGLPLAIHLASHFTVTGFDIDEARISELQNGYDRTNEISRETLLLSKMFFTHDANLLKNQEIYIITVPTPVTNNNLPDLEPLRKASTLVAKYISRGAIIVFESTVYPGVTEDYCGFIIASISKLTSGQDFYLGYSPERINPGDKIHTIDKITKVVSGQTAEVEHILAYVYGKINSNNVFVAKNIKTAEAAKVIENAQRDINIAFINEVATITNRLQLSIYDVLQAAQTKWNFLNFQPGLVGGHCIGVDPYYLAFCARSVGIEPQIILSGRQINENMGSFLSFKVHQELLNLRNNVHNVNILILGFTFKENVPDIRNTKVIDVIQILTTLGYNVDIHDHLADPELTKKIFNINLLSQLSGQYDCIIAAVPHDFYKHMQQEQIMHLLKPNALIVDFKNIWSHLHFSTHVTYLSL